MQTAQKVLVKAIFGYSFRISDFWSVGRSPRGFVVCSSSDACSSRTRNLLVLDFDASKSN